MAFRPIEYDAELVLGDVDELASRKRRYLAALRRIGRVGAAARSIGCHRRIAVDWRRHDPSFAAEEREIRERLEVEAEIRRLDRREGLIGSHA